MTAEVQVSAKRQRMKLLLSPRAGLKFSQDKKELPKRAALNGCQGRESIQSLGKSVQLQGKETPMVVVIKWSQIQILAYLIRVPRLWLSREQMEVDNREMKETRKLFLEWQSLRDPELKGT